MNEDDRASVVEFGPQFVEPRIARVDPAQVGLDRHADYNPAVFNRLGRYLRDQGKPAPAQDAPLTPGRPLRDRPGVTVA
jgi:hypothetical protein